MEQLPRPSLPQLEPGPGVGADEVWGGNVEIGPDIDGNWVEFTHTRAATPSSTKFRAHAILRKVRGSQRDNEHRVTSNEQRATKGHGGLVDSWSWGEVVDLFVLGDGVKTWAYSARYRRVGNRGLAWPSLLNITTPARMLAVCTCITRLQEK